MDDELRGSRIAVGTAAPHAWLPILLRSVGGFFGIAMLISACAVEKDTAPANVPIDIDFPSAAAAVAVDGVKLFVFEGARQCNELVRLRQTAQAFPTTTLETPAISPCALLHGTNNVVELPRDKDYTVVAIGDMQGKDLFVGCAVQIAFGATKALPIPLTYIDSANKIPDTTCTKLSDKCDGRCN